MIGEVINSRNVHGCVGEVVVGCHAETALDLLLGVGKVSNDKTLGLDPVGLEVNTVEEIGVCCLAVVALVVVVGAKLPVGGSIHAPHVIELVVIPVVDAESLLLVLAPECLLPGDGIVGTRKVDPDKLLVVNVNMDGEEAVIGSLEVWVVGSLDEAAAQVVHIAVALAGKVHAVVANSLLGAHDGRGAVSAEVVEGLDATLLVAADDEVKVGDIVQKPVSSLEQTLLVCDEKPHLGEDGSPLKLVHLL